MVFVDLQFACFDNMTQLFDLCSEALAFFELELYAGTGQRGLYGLVVEKMCHRISGEEYDVVKVHQARLPVLLIQ